MRPHIFNPCSYTATQYNAITAQTEAISVPLRDFLCFCVYSHSASNRFMGDITHQVSPRIQTGSDANLQTRARISPARSGQFSSRRLRQDTFGSSIDSNMEYPSNTSYFRSNTFIHWVYAQLASPTTSCRFLHHSWLAAGRHIRRRKYRHHAF